MPTLSRCEVWTTWQCASGTRQAFIPLSEIAVLTTTERTQHDDEGQLVLSKESAASSSIEPGVVIRLLYSDASFTEWVVWTIDDSSKESRVMRISLRSVLTALDGADEVLSETTATEATVDLEWKALSPSSIVTKILAFAPAWWAAGTITPTIPVDLAPSGWMPLRAFRELVATIKAQAVSCELHYRRNGTTGYYIDIVTSIGSSEPTLDVRTAKNLMGMSRRRDREKYAVEVVPLGTGTPRAMIGKAWWECTAKSTNVLTFQQPVTGGTMIGFDDQINGLYMVDDTGARQQISDCVAGATQTVTVASGTNFTVGRWYRAVFDSSGNEIVRLRKAEATAGTVRLVESSSLDVMTNLTKNPAMRVWTGGDAALPDDWTNSGAGAPTFARTTTAGLWVYGGQSLRVTTASVTFSQNIFTANLTVYVPSWVTAITASVWLRPVVMPNQSSITLEVDSAAVGGTTSITSLALNQWSRVDHTVSTGFSVGAVHALRSRVIFQCNVNTAMDCYVDAAQLAFAASPAPFFEGSNPAKLWAMGNQYLATYSTVPTSYGATFADLNQWDPNGFPYDTVALGQTASVYDSDLGITTSGRIIELRRDWKNPLASHLTISTRPEEFVSLLTGIAA